MKGQVLELTYFNIYIPTPNQLFQTRQNPTMLGVGWTDKHMDRIWLKKF